MFKSGDPLVPSDLRPSRVYLTGFMGAGKSTVGPLLAEYLGWSFVDTDHWIEKVTGLSASQWIEREGEVEFRRVESWAIDEISNQTLQVISLGGGAILRDETLSWVKSLGWLLYLSANTDSLWARLSIGGVDRPLLKKLGDQIDRSSFSEFLQKREKYYLQADLSVVTDDKSPTQIAAELGAALIKNGMIR